MYRCEATSIAGFIQQLAVAYIAHGYWFYVYGTIPAHKDPRLVDRKLIARYGLDISKWTRCRQRKQGRASVQYLRYDRFFVVVATPGKHEFFEFEGSCIRDFRRWPLHFAGYSIACRRFRDRWHAAVRLDKSTFEMLKAQFSSLGARVDLQVLGDCFRQLDVEPYAAVRRQLLQILHAVNLLRRSGGREPVSSLVLRLNRQSVQVK